MWKHTTLWLFFFMALVVCSHIPSARAAEDCSKYTKYSEPYFNCMFSSQTAGFRNSCEKTKDPRFPDVEVTKLMAHDGMYDAAQPKFLGLVKDGVSIDCPKDQPGGVPYWDGNDPNKGKIVINYAPCLGDVKPDDTFLDHLDCTPVGKLPNAVDDLIGSMRPPAQVASLADGECKKLYSVTFCGELHAPYICAYVPNGPSKFYIGCNPVAPNTATLTASPLSCFVPNLCWDKKAIANVSKNNFNFSISGAVVLCAEGAIEKVFYSGWDSTTAIKKDLYGGFSGKDGGECPTVSMFSKLQDALRKAALAAISLWVILWGVRVAVSGNPPSRGEFIKNIIVLSLVIYFSLGGGWIDYIPVLKQLMASLSQAMITAVTQNDHGTLCVFKASDYPKGFETMALWDTFDCKIVTYFFSNQTFPKILEVAILSIFTFFTYGILIFFLSIMLAFFLVGLLIYSVEIYVVTLIMIALLVFLSPIFVPMALFNSTKGYFKSWLNEIISSSLYPVMLFGFIAMMLGVFDRFYFGDCEDSATAKCSVLPFGVEAETTSLGAQMQSAVVDWSSSSVSGFSFDLYLFALLKVCFFAYLFYRFMDILGSFLEELLGTTRTDVASMTSGAGQKAMRKGVKLTQKAAQTAVGAYQNRNAGGGGGGGGNKTIVRTNPNNK